MVGWRPFPIRGSVPSYVVSDRMWTIFTRFGKNDLRGVRGTDARTIAMLREKFDLEFLAAKMRAK